MGHNHLHLPARPLIQPILFPLQVLDHLLGHEDDLAIGKLLKLCPDSGEDVARVPLTPGIDEDVRVQGVWDDDVSYSVATKWRTLGRCFRRIPR
jgi:hypothetical protein